MSGKIVAFPPRLPVSEPEYPRQNIGMRDGGPIDALAAIGVEPGPRLYAAGLRSKLSKLSGFVNPSTVADHVTRMRSLPIDKLLATLHYVTDTKLAMNPAYYTALAQVLEERHKEMSDVK